MSRAFSYMERDQTAGGKQMKIGEVSKLTGVGVEAIRFYEKSGLLDRPVRTHSGYRVYGDDVLERIAFIRQAQVLGFSLDQIRQLIAYKKKGESPCLEAREIVRQRLAELNEQLAQLTKYRDELTDALADWDKQGRSDGHVCGLIESSHIEHKVGKKKL